MSVGVKSMAITRVTSLGHEGIEDWICVEEPFEIRIAQIIANTRQVNPISVTMRTPGHDDELAIGFLFTESIIKTRQDVFDWESPAQNVMEINLHSDVTVGQLSLSRNFYTTSSCGICGKASIDAIQMPDTSIGSSMVVSAVTLELLPDKLRQAQQNFQSTGGLHASALFEREGNLVLVREDVGRHNALDKVIGYSFLNGQTSLSDMLLLVSGRASFELVQKAAMAGIPIMAAIGAPSSLAVELAHESGITLIGFLNNHRFNIYTHPHRII